MPLKSLKKAAKKSERVYVDTVTGAGTIVNGVMTPLTITAQQVVEPFPVVGRPLTRVAKLPRTTTRYTTQVVKKLPGKLVRSAYRTAKGIPKALMSTARTAANVIGHTVVDPLIMFGFDSSAMTSKKSKSKNSKPKTSRRR